MSWSPGENAFQSCTWKCFLQESLQQWCFYWKLIYLTTRIPLVHDLEHLRGFVESVFNQNLSCCVSQSGFVAVPSTNFHFPSTSLDVGRENSCISVWESRTWDSSRKQDLGVKPETNKPQTQSGLLWLIFICQWWTKEETTRCHSILRSWEGLSFWQESCESVAELDVLNRAQVQGDVSTANERCRVWSRVCPSSWD